MGEVVGADRAALSEAGERATTERAGTNAADLFRHLLEEHHLGEEILGTVNLYLQAKGVRITTGTIVDATLIHALSSTKNREQSRDPEMHQTRKGKQWCVSRT